MSNSNLIQSRCSIVRDTDSLDSNTSSGANVSETPTELETDIITRNYIQLLEATFEKEIISNIEDNPIAIIRRDYGDDILPTTTNSMNSYIKRPDVKEKIESGDYPLVQSRTNSSTFKFEEVEIADFIVSSGYSPVSLNNDANTVSLNIISNLESFYTESHKTSSMGSFCSLVPTIFGSINSFFLALGAVKSAASLDNQSSSLLSSLKEKISNTIDSIISQEKNKLDNLELSNSDTEPEPPEDILAQFHKIKEQASSFYDSDNTDLLKTKTNSLIDYAVNIFDEPKIEEIQFLVYRFCGFVSQLESEMQNISKPATDYASSYSDNSRILRVNSSANTIRAVNGGARRYTASSRQSTQQKYEKAYTDAGNQPPLTAEDFKNITPWNNGKGDSRIKFIGRWPRVLGRDGWEKVDPKVRAMLMKVQKDFGKQLNVNSGYRSPAYNAKLKGAAKNSMHLRGKALDISWSGFNPTSREEFIRLAKKHGFRGIGRYGPSAGNFVHIDVGNTRSWSKGI